MSRNHAILTPWHFLMLAFAAGIVLGTVMVNAGAGSEVLAAGKGRQFLASVGQGAVLFPTRETAILVILRRLLEVSFCWALGLTRMAIPGFAGVSLYLGISSSVILSVFTMERGLLGPVFYGAAFFPHGLIYLPVFLLLAFWGIAREKRLHRAAFVLLLLVTVAGGLMEVYVNPRILSLLL